MKKIIVEPAFWEIFPEAQINVLVAKGVDNHRLEEKDADFADLLNNAAKEARSFVTEEPFSQNPVVAEWREALTKFKTKKGARSSIEAMLKRANQDRTFSPINPLVDMYNSVSLKHAVPCGGEDIQTISGDLRLGKAEGGEPFLPLGAEKDAPALPGEIMYYDQDGAVCRCLNWREAQRTMLTEDTTDAVLVIESINKEQAGRADQAIQELKTLIDTYFSIDSSIATLTESDPSYEL